MTVTAVPTNHPPTAQNDTATTTAGTAGQRSRCWPTTATRTATRLQVTAATKAAHGAVVINSDNTITYTPQAGFVGTDTFTYTISDGQGGSGQCHRHRDGQSRRTVPRWPERIRRRPDKGTAVKINVLANDTDPDGNPLTGHAVTKPAFGVVVINPDSTITYTPAGGFLGTTPSATRSATAREGPPPRR